MYRKKNMTMKYLKTFENYNQGINEEIFGIGKSADEKAYKLTADFLNGDSEEAKKVKELFKKMKPDEKTPIKIDTNIMKQITLLGSQWANKNKMEAKDYAFSQIRTVLEKDFSRIFKGGVDVTTGS
jgi:hypothetical protein